ncbi:MAG TPA: 2-C-methyl-D-erythritol 2,4-cyclodiphosphate synthase [Leptospiraceae bacterium]|mgnify:CR=1 FL=1|nr:2-C-methyl-D-erythritol 2,4-cyclodiphosphate synthase [Spirochaetaceae bacterium]HBS03349.1 2-C-methyl-D-erythritol 2,4-cyclodiphosphate synthase [Leptospiraceae bacterium]|tara:strand:- start:1436 stop:1918 length:483 start_codon:yes stop_codon:yes gene_type:complete
MDLRIGQGIDFHRLIEDPERPLLLGGVEIPGQLALKGHSDADVILHAITDAILGALALGDLGEFFPDTDPAFKNADSALLLQTALKEMQDRQFRVQNVDLTVMGERPKLAPYRPEIKKKVASLLAIAEESTGIKATTTEKMGFLGRGEGLGCMAVILLVK